MFGGMFNLCRFLQPTGCGCSQQNRTMRLVPAMQVQTSRSRPDAPKMTHRVSARQFSPASSLWTSGDATPSRRLRKSIYHCK